MSAGAYPRTGVPRYSDKQAWPDFQSAPSVVLKNEVWLVQLKTVNFISGQESDDVKSKQFGIFI